MGWREALILEGWSAFFLWKNFNGKSIDFINVNYSKFLINVLFEMKAFTKLICEFAILGLYKFIVFK
ncbi:hypothetical protein M918_15155 [Clostridium sp. BL8]|nr:hypothetical protein M918_15155 [Clostridium sp. BL8]